MHPNGGSPVSKHCMCNAYQLQSKLTWMSGTDPLLLVPDNAKAMIQELEVENRLLLDGNPQQASELDNDQERDHLKELNEQFERSAG